MIALVNKLYLASLGYFALVACVGLLRVCSSSVLEGCFGCCGCVCRNSLFLVMCSFLLEVLFLAIFVVVSWHFVGIFSCFGGLLCRSVALSGGFFTFSGVVASLSLVLVC